MRLGFSMSHSYTFQILADTDATVLRDMLGVFGDAFAEPRTYLDQQPDDAYLRQLLEADSFVAIAALSGAQVVGGLAGYVLQKFEQPRSELYIYDLAVAPAHRRRGVATAMIEEVRALAARRDCHVVFVQADYEDDAAVALYSKLGTREEVLHFDISPAGAA